MKKVLILAIVLGMTPILAGCPASDTKKDADPAATPAPSDTPPAEPEK